MEGRLILKTQKHIYLILAQFMISLASIFGSLFFSEVMKFPPCNLCWYQRIFIYPVALIILTGLFLGSKDTNKILTPFISMGLIFAIYHNLVYYKVIQVIVPCTETAPCTAQQLNYLGFITIPLLSLSAFVALIILNLLTIKLESKKETYEK
jgi:disulfide bond formation protein DsbB